jgi:Fe-S cluster assembly protein SufD
MAQAIQDTSRAAYLSELEAWTDHKTPDWLCAIQGEAAARVADVTFPHSRMEAWRHTNISPIVKTPFRAVEKSTKEQVQRKQVDGFLFGEAGWCELVFIDGHFSRDLSSVPELPDGVVAGSLADAIQEDLPVVKAHLNHHVPERNAYTVLNTAFIQDGAFVHVPKNCVLENPIHCVFISTGQESDSAAYVRNLFVLESCSEASIVTAYYGLSDDRGYLHNVVEEISVGENAHLKRYKVVKEGTAGNHLATTEVHQERNSSFNSCNVTQAGKIVRNELCVDLEGDGASCTLTGVYLNDEDRIVDNALQVNHYQPHCSSRIGYKGVLEGRSKTNFTGKVYVAREAQQTDSDQLSQNLLLSDQATIDSKPQLEIFADDVKCTHGTTIGPPPEEILFYFLSRGIAESAARGMLTFGFADEKVQEISLRPLATRLEEYLTQRYAPRK